MNRMYTRFTKKRSKVRSRYESSYARSMIKRKRIIGLFLEIKGL